MAEAGDIAQEIARYEEQILQKRELHEAVRRRLQVLEMEGKAPARVRIAAMAIEPSKPDRDRRVLLTVMAVVGAMVAGVGVGYMRASMDKRIYDAAEVQGMYQAPFLGLLPRLAASHVPRELGGGAAAEAKPGTGADPGANARVALMESMRMIRTALLERLGQTGDKVVLVTSALPRTGKTSVSLLLAKTLAVVGKKVLLVDADLRKPVLAERLGLEAPVGLAAMLVGPVPDDQAILQTPIARMSVLTAGHVPADFDTELLANGVFSACIERWRGAYDFIIVDSPPILSVADAQILARYADGTLMILRSSHDRRTEALKAYVQLSNAGGVLLGTILIGGRFGRDYGYSYEYGYYYSYAYGYGYGGRGRKDAEEKGEAGTKSS